MKLKTTTTSLKTLRLQNNLWIQTSTIQPTRILMQVFHHCHWRYLPEASLFKRKSHLPIWRFWRRKWRLSKSPQMFTLNLEHAAEEWGVQTEQSIDILQSCAVTARNRHRSNSIENKRSEASIHTDTRSANETLLELDRPLFHGSLLVSDIGTSLTFCLIMLIDTKDICGFT